MADKQQDYKQRLDAYFALCDREASRSLSLYLDRVFIDTKPEPKRLSEIVEDWQQERHDQLIPVLEHAAGIRERYQGPRRYWYEAMRGLDKTSGIARLCNWLLTYSTTSLNIIICAADKDQAKLLYTAMKVQASLPHNKWFGAKLSFLTNSVEGPGGKLTVLASDGDTNQGQAPDLLICDELTVWKKRSLWDALYSTGIKRPSTFVCLVISNCGYLDTWNRELRETVRETAESDNSEWFLHAQAEDTYPASWMTPEVIEREAKFLSPAEADRLLRSKWVRHNAVSPYLTEEQITPCIGQPLRPIENAKVILTLDYGTGIEVEETGETRDRAAASTQWWDGNKVHTWEVACWDGGRDNKEVPVETVVNWVEERLLLYHDVIIVADKHQLVGELQKWEARGIVVERVRFLAGEFNAAIATNLKNLILNKQIIFAADAGALGAETLATELKDLVQVEKSYGTRFTNAKGKHDDRSFVVATGALKAVKCDPTIVPTRPKQTPPPPPFPKSLNPLAAVQRLDWAARRGLFGLSRQDQITQI